MSQKHVARVHDAFALGRRDDHSSAGVDRQEASMRFLVPRQQDANRLAKARRRIQAIFREWPRKPSPPAQRSSAATKASVSGANNSSAVGAPEPASLSARAG